jgi:prepilin-type N-terminal cleavage/methylation domain-containing protein
VSAHRSVRDAGFTLVEMLITVSLLGVASGAILTAMFTSMQTVQDTSTRFVNANNRNFSTKYVIPDVQAAVATEDGLVAESPTHSLQEGKNLQVDCPTSPQPILEIRSPLGATELVREYDVVWRGTECRLIRYSGESGEVMEETEVLAGLRRTDPVCIDHIRAGYDYAANPMPSDFWCVPDAAPNATYERPTLRIWISDSDETPVGSYDYVLTASSRVGRVSR